MTQTDDKLVATGASTPGDAEAIAYLARALAAGEPWYPAMLRAMGMWSSPEESLDGRTWRYLIDGEAFDWQLLAERLCDTVADRLPEAERDALLFHGRPPLELSAAEVRELIGAGKYGHYLNYFYGVIVEGALLLTVQEDIEKERRLQVYRVRRESTDEAYRRVYNADRDELLHRFRQERGYPQLKSITVSQLKEFTYWLFKYRLKKCEKARIASDTTRALAFLKEQWRRGGVYGALAADGINGAGG